VTPEQAPPRRVSPPDQLTETVRTVAGGDALLAPTITRRLIEEHVSRSPAGGPRPERLAPITRRELEVLSCIARGLSNCAMTDDDRNHGQFVSNWPATPMNTGASGL
jgi:hypothetical protein